MLVSLANQRLIRFRQRKRRKIGAHRRHLKSRPAHNHPATGSHCQALSMVSRAAVPKTAAELYKLQASIEAKIEQQRT